MRQASIFLPVVTATAFLALLSGCPSSGGGGEGVGVSVEQPEADGVISGHVVVIDRGGGRVGDKSGVHVSVVEQGASGVSASDGSWIITGVAPGSLTLVWEKPGFALSKRIGLRFDGGKLTNVKGWVVEMPKHYVEVLGDSTAGSELYFVGTVGGDTSFSSGAIRLFIGPTAGVSAAPGTYRVTIKGMYDLGAGGEEGGAMMRTAAYPASFSIRLDPYFRSQLGAGTTAYAVAYADAFQSLSYIDSAAGGEVFTTLNPRPSPVIRFVIP
jgi:hypothetical protein